MNDSPHYKPYSNPLPKPVECNRHVPCPKHYELAEDNHKLNAEIERLRARIAGGIKAEAIFKEDGTFIEAQPDYFEVHMETWTKRSVLILKDEP